MTFEDVAAGDHAVEIAGVAAECRVSGQNPRGVTTAAGDTTTVAFEGTCGLRDRIAFYSHRDGNDEIYTMAADGSDQTRLTENDLIERRPDVSPDGSYIAFATISDIWVMEADGSNRTPLVEDAVLLAEPAWSPDGSKIAFHSSRDGNREIYVMGSDGSEPTNLTQKAGGDFRPAWSPQTTGGPGPDPGPSGDCQVAAP